MVLDDILLLNKFNFKFFATIISAMLSAILFLEKLFCTTLPVVGMLGRVLNVWVLFQYIAHRVWCNPFLLVFLEGESGYCYPVNTYTNTFM